MKAAHGWAAAAGILGLAGIIATGGERGVPLLVQSGLAVTALALGTVGAVRADQRWNDAALGAVLVCAGLATGTQRSPASFAGQVLAFSCLAFAAAMLLWSARAPSLAIGAVARGAAWRIALSAGVATALLLVPWATARFVSMRWSASVDVLAPAALGAWGLLCTALVGAWTAWRIGRFPDAPVVGRQPKD